MEALAVCRRECGGPDSVQEREWRPWQCAGESVEALAVWGQAFLSTGGSAEKLAVWVKQGPLPGSVFWGVGGIGTLLACIICWYGGQRVVPTAPHPHLEDGAEHGALQGAAARHTLLAVHGAAGHATEHILDDLGNARHTRAGPHDLHAADILGPHARVGQSLKCGDGEGVSVNRMTWASSPSTSAFLPCQNCAPYLFDRRLEAVKQRGTDDLQLLTGELAAHVRVLHDALDVERGLRVGTQHALELQGRGKVWTQS